MMNIEYVRNLNCNYERILLEHKPDEMRYQYCILGRCRIKGLLPCSLRYINGGAYLYYDISSKQNLASLFGNRCITREWMKDFVWSLRQLRQELERFLLDTNNILWYPEQIFQDLENNVFSFLYIPYYEGEESFIKLMEFWVEHIEYKDEVLVECVYRMYERLERNGAAYLQAQIFEDAECLEKIKNAEVVCTVLDEKPADVEGEVIQETAEIESGERQDSLPDKAEKGRKKGIRGVFESKRSRGKKARVEYSQAMKQAMVGYAVAEETDYEGRKHGQTLYIEDKTESSGRPHRLLTPEGRLLMSLERQSLSIGKKKGEVDFVLEDESVSRMHARITLDGDSVYLEDLNSTNGTFRNGRQMQPYEKARLDEGDEIKCGRVVFIFR